jgi:hypothetical protein
MHSEIPDMKILRLAATCAMAAWMMPQGAEAFDRTLPTVAQHMMILPLEDKGGNASVAQLLSDDVTQAFVVGGRLQVVTNTADADLVLRWTLQRYDQIPLQFDSNNVPVRYRLQMLVDVDMLDAKTGEVRLTSRKSVDLTPVPGGSVSATAAAADEASTQVPTMDSEDIRTLREFISQTVVNSMGLPPEDDFAAQQRLCTLMAHRVIRLVLSGSFAPGANDQPTPDPALQQ